MKSIDRTMYRGVLFAGVLIAVFASSSGHARSTTKPDLTAELTTETEWQKVCIDKWRDAAAYGHCSSATVARLAQGSSSDSGHCVVNGSCSITVAVDNVDTTFTPGMSNLSQSPNDTESLDICFAAASATAAAAGYSATVKSGCATGETTSSDATTNGLADRSASGS